MIQNRLLLCYLLKKQGTLHSYIIYFLATHEIQTSLINEQLLKTSFAEDSHEESWSVQNAST